MPFARRLKGASAMDNRKNGLGAVTRSPQHGLAETWLKIDTHIPRACDQLCEHYHLAAEKRLARTLSLKRNQKAQKDGIEAFPNKAPRLPQTNKPTVFSRIIRGGGKTRQRHDS